jgi:hypothetical protein
MRSSICGLVAIAGTVARSAARASRIFYSGWASPGRRDAAAS